MTEQSSDTHSRPYLHHFHHPTSCQASISILTTNITFLYGPISRIPQQFQPSFLPLRVLPCVLCPVSQLVIQNSRFSKLQQKTSHTVAEHVMVVSFFIETNNNELLRKNHMHTQNCKGRNIDSWTACMLTNCFAIQKFNKQLLNPVLTFERVGNLHYSREGLNNIYFTEVSSIYLVLNLQKV